ncbi:MAG: bifunctional hydroxymethylpyrimidine kinase/phosphomethylpyrimidine kinase [Chloroflexota bacterium]
MNQQPRKVLTIGGWDPCGAFGVAADIKTFSAMQCYGMAVMTVVTAQNSLGWHGAEFVSADLVAQQLDAVLGDYGAQAVKTGFLGKLEIIETVAAKLKEYAVPNVIVDPVLLNAQGAAMFPAEVVSAYKNKLFPLATAITPNRRELNWLMTGETESLMWSAETELQVLSFADSLQKTAIVLKGMKQVSGEWADGLIENGAVTLFPHERVETRNVSGTGDSLSAAICCLLAEGLSLKDAVKKASQLTVKAIAGAVDWQLGTGPGAINHNLMR